jgi:hypothetical protein
MAVHLVRCEHLGDAIERIGQEHVPNRWLYRGQTYRRDVHCIIQENQAFELENLYPQSFRFAANHATISQAFTEQWQKEYAKAEALFNAFNSFLISKYEAGQRAESGRFAWMDPYADELRRIFKGAGPSVFSGFHEKGIGMKNPEFIRLSWSLAQHYGVVTALLDLTFDLDVAAWFATNLWDAPRQPQPLKGDGIIYRFDIQTLMAGIMFFNGWLESVSDANIYKAPPDKAFIQDLRHIPTAFALRPTRQEAAVVSGFDALHFVRQFDIAGKIDAFIFPHLGEQLLRWPHRHSRECLIPLDDPFLELKREFDAQWKPHAEQTYGVRYTKPVVILTDVGIKLANVQDKVADQQREAAREQLYESGMASLGTAIGEAESKFQAVIKMAPYGVSDRLSSLAYVRIAVILFLRDDFPGTEEALDKSLDGPDRNPQESWVGQLLNTIAQGAQMLRSKGKGELALPVLKRLAAIAHRSGPGALALEAELGAVVLIGALELERGNTQSGLLSLESVAQRPLTGLTLPQRSFVAAALQVLAQAHDALGEKQRARAFYKDIVARFGGDEWPMTVQIVAHARKDTMGSALDIGGE